MTLRTGSLALFSLFVLAACIAVPFIPQTIQPFNATVSPGNPVVIEILPSSVGISMPEGLKVGDRMDFAELSPETRGFFMVGGLNAPAGTSMDLPIRRDDGIHHVEVRFQPVGFLNGDTQNRVIEFTAYAVTVLIALLGLLLLWRGQNRVTLGVALYCFSSFFQLFLGSLPLPVPWCQYLGWGSNVLQNLVTLFSLYLVADGLTAVTRLPDRRRRLHVGFAATLALYLAGVIYNNAAIYFHGSFPSAATQTGIVGLHFLGFMIPLGMLLTSYRRSDPVTQARMRWILLSLLGLLLSYALSQLAGRTSLSLSVLTVIGTLLYVVSFVGFAYAVLKHRLVSLQLVLNRALVYGLITSLVVGVFAAMLSFLEHNAINSQTNQFLALLIPLVLGMGINSLKRRVDDYINAAFFRRRHQSIAELTQFARTCSLIEDPDKLLDLTAESLYRNSGAQGVAVFAVQKGKTGPKLVRRQGPLPFPEKISNDDLALLRLRAGDAEVDLHGTFSGIEAEGYTYPLTVRGELMGFIVVGPRPADSYSLEERRLFVLAAQQVGIALHAQRLQEQHKLLQAIAKGAYKSLPKARAKAKALIEATAA